MKRVGIFGGGQLGRMLVEAAKVLGVECKVIEEGSSCSASKVIEVFQTKYDNIDDIAKYLSDVDIVTYEFENIPQKLLEKISSIKPVYPPLKALEISRHRGKEKSFVNSLGIKTPEFLIAKTFEDLKQQADNIKFPVIVKTCTEGYDGKGQWRFEDKASLLNFSDNVVLKSEIIAEQKVNFEYEFSCIGARSTNGEIQIYPLCENVHDKGILDYTKSPSSWISKIVTDKAISATTKLLSELDYVGVIAVEYFAVQDEIVFNEYAPRVHNSGHWTIEGARASQFENHIRACLGMELVKPEPIGYSFMINLLGTKGDENKLKSLESVTYHWYDKLGLGDRRKVGHVTAVYKTEEERNSQLEVLRAYCK